MLWTPAGRWSDGHFTVTRGFGSLLTREKFGDVQLHVEWAVANPVNGNSQRRGNSGVLLMARTRSRYWTCGTTRPTRTERRRSTGSGRRWCRAARQPGEWNTYDIVFEAPQFDGESW